jgi:hypothetical protein
MPTIPTGAFGIMAMNAGTSAIPARMTGRIMTLSVVEVP